MPYCASPRIGFSRWYGSRDKDGYREYHIFHKVFVDPTVGANEGPAVALNYPGLPLPGAIWAFAGDLDIEAICQYDAEMRPMVEERTNYFEIEQIFSSKPTGKCINRTGTGCVGTGNPANDPLLEPPILSGGFTKYTEEKQYDRFDKPITNSAFERLRGPSVEFDSNRITIRAQINESTLDLPGKQAKIDTVNGVSMWGFDARQVKLSNISWEQKFTAACSCYYTIIYEFEVSKTGWDRQVLDEGTKVLRGQWNKTTGAWELVGSPSATNPRDFIRLLDINGNPMRGVLNGSGVPINQITGTGTDKPGTIDIKYYPEVEFLEEIPGLPSNLECCT